MPQRSQVTAYTLTQMITSSVRYSILASPLVPNTAKHLTAVRDPTTVLRPASPPPTAQAQRRCAQMHTATVSHPHPGPGISKAAARLTRHTFLAFDDQTSTFIIPSGGGFEVIFCPSGRSSNILKVLGDQLREVAATGHVTEDGVQALSVGEYPKQSLGIRQSQVSRSGLLALLSIPTLFATSFLPF